VGLINRLKTWRRSRIIARAPFDWNVWHESLARLPFLDGLSRFELEQLRQSATLFLHQKSIVGAGAIEVDHEMRTLIALQACILILNLDIDYYRGWVEVVVYPDEFVPEHEYTDDAGVVHMSREPSIGECWQQGPVVLSWSQVLPSGRNDGVNVVIHEFAHKLDMLNGDANGFPPLHHNMSRSAWSEAWTGGYEDFCGRAEREDVLEIDPYGAESPAEFFAVMSEAFFLTPRRVLKRYPAIYEQLKLFYRQDPASRLSN
jgi:Mlc titration factor MtfA (ptsG expression regulator)